MSAPRERRAQEIVRDYRSEPRFANGMSELESKVLSKLEKDPDINGRDRPDGGGRVSAAFNNRILKQLHPHLLLFYLIQSIDLAQSVPEIREDYRIRERKYRQAAAHAAALADFCEREINIYHKTLVQLRERLDRQAELYSRGPALLQITQKSLKGSSLLALQHFAKKMREEFKIDRMPHDAIQALFEVAMGFHIGEAAVTEGLRAPKVGISNEKEQENTQNQANPLKLRSIPGGKK